MPANAVAFLVALVVLAGCAQRETLLPKSAVAPSGVDLSGNWRLVDESGDGLRRSGKRDGLLHFFIESGTRLKITQTAEGLFISFDRAIVEEYRFGEQRVVNVGPVQADRVSGWEGPSYVIETLGPENNKLLEAYRLEDGGNTLLRQVSVFRQGSLARSVVQTFERA